MTAGAEAGRIASWCMRQALVPSALAAIAILALVILRPDAAAVAYALSAPMAVLLAFVTLALGGLLAFDALLFRLVASYDDVTDGCAAVDELLARMRLKPLPGSTRPLPDRMAGTRRLVRYQRVALAACLATAGLAVLG